MKWHHSLITRVTLIFALALLAIGGVFISLANHERNKDTAQMMEYSHVALRSVFDNSTKTLDLKKLEELGFVPIYDVSLKQTILEHQSSQKNYPMKHMQERFRINIDAVAYQQNIYSVLRKKDGETLVFKTPYEKEFFPRILVPFLIIGLILILYIGIIRSLLPLKNLRNQIKAFADGQYDINCQSSKKDEIGALANEFDITVKKIKSLRDARQLFLRNIMHELKTPITKGKLAVEMIEEGAYANILRNAFTRQEALLEEFTRIEKLSADELKLDIKPYLLEDVVDFALDILDDKKEAITTTLVPLSVHVDFELFGVVLKNLLDNGLSYATDKKVYMSNTHNSITISNTAPPLEFPLERYAEPYFLEGKKQRSARGLGFGLFITWHVIRLHGMRISYEHTKGVNAFTIYM